ncbi:MAG: NAD-dependent succinate-semialdehyde dehydrogenase [Bdellovibrionales bacterium]|nr:NAD-dependent succinate-semialdehyde dehydrogenase [Bdellovibrionales bacterium]
METKVKSAIQSVSPHTGKVIRTFTPHSRQDVEEMLRGLTNAQREWSHSSFQERSHALREVARRLRQQKLKLAEIAHQEMGKQMGEAVAEVEKCATCCDYYAERGPDFLAPEPVATEARKSYVHFAPLGVVLAIMPWNFPFWQAVRCAAPAIMAGNAVILKHASNVTNCALELQEIFAGIFPGGPLFGTAIIGGAAALDMISFPEVAAVSFTGSTPVGKKVAEAAGRHLKKSVLELGGSDAYLVLADADLDRAAFSCAFSRLINAGQSCIAAKRFIVEAPAHDRFVDLLADQMKRMSLAPLAREDLRRELQEQVDASVKEGARLVMGGGIPAGDGFFYPATVLAEVRPGMTVFDQETFGPVAAVVKAKSRDEAITLANQSSFGLGAAVFTQTVLEGERIARDLLEAGNCFVNTYVRSDARLPFGGMKESGLGRELSYFGVREFTQPKTVYIAP